MTTTNIRQPQATSDQLQRIKRLLEASDITIDLRAFEFTVQEAQDIIERCNLIEDDVKARVAYLLKKLAIHDLRFEPAVGDFDLVVPGDYEPYLLLERCITNNWFGYDNEEITQYVSVITASPPCVLERGKTYGVKIHPFEEGSITAPDAQAFITSQNGIFVGAQGLLLTVLLYPDQLPDLNWVVRYIYSFSSEHLGIEVTVRKSDDAFRFRAREVGSNSKRLLVGKYVLYFYEK